MSYTISEDIWSQKSLLPREISGGNATEMNLEDFCRNQINKEKKSYKNYFEGILERTGEPPAEPLYSSFFLVLFVSNRFYMIDSILF